MLLRTIGSKHLSMVVEFKSVAYSDDSNSIIFQYSPGETILEITEDWLKDPDIYIGILIDNGDGSTDQFSSPDMEILYSKISDIVYKDGKITIIMKEEGVD